MMIAADRIITTNCVRKTSLGWLGKKSDELSKKKLHQINISRTLVTYVYKYSFQDSHLNMKRKRENPRRIRLQTISILSCECLIYIHQGENEE